MGRASKNRGPIGHKRGQDQCLPDSPGERKAPCSLAPWQLPPKVSPPDDVPTRTAHPPRHPSPRTAVTVSQRLQDYGEPIRRLRPARQAHHTAPRLVRRRHGPHRGQLEARTQERTIQPIRRLTRRPPAPDVIDPTHPQARPRVRDVVEAVTKPILTRASHLATPIRLTDGSSTLRGPGRVDSTATPVPSGTGERCVPSRTTPVAARRGGGPVSV